MAQHSRTVFRGLSVGFLLVALVATALNGVIAEEEVPLESQCRPYVEKALKQLETGDTTEGTTEGSEDDNLSSENLIAESLEDSGQDEHATSTETAEDTRSDLESSEVKEDEDANTAEDTTENSTEEPEVAEEQHDEETQSDEAQGEEHQDEEQSEEQNEEDIKSDEEAMETAEESVEEEILAESVEPLEAGVESTENSAEETAENGEEHGDSVEDETQAEDQDETKEDSIEETGPEEVHSEEEQANEEEGDKVEESVEGETEEEGTNEEEDTKVEDSVEGEAQEEGTNEEDGDKTEESVEGEAEEEGTNEEDDEKVEDSVESETETDGQENVEETHEEDGETNEESTEETVEGDQGVESDEQKESEKEAGDVQAESDEAVEAQEQADEPAESSDNSEEPSGEQKEEEGEESKEEVVGEESQADESDDKQESEDVEAASTEEQDAESKTEGDELSRETEEVKEESKGDDEVQESKEDAEGQQEEDAEETEGDATADGESEESHPEEDLLLGFDIPENLRDRSHINELLHLDEEHIEKDLVLEKSTDIILRELKRLYDNAIKPLETLYKYRDLSNRHFGDPEIFSKPLVLFMGPWSGGKSSILNYLTENEYTPFSLRTGAEPSPAYFNILMHGEEPEILDGTQLAADWTFSGLQKFGQGLEDRLRGLKLPSKLLEKVNMVEIPGILEVRKQVSRLFPFNDACQWFIDRADIIFLVYDPSKLDVGPETEAILDQLKGREYQTRIILNKADQVKPEELMRVQGALIWNISPLMSSAQPPVMYTTSLWSMPYEAGAPVRLLQAQERALLRDLRGAIDRRIDHKIASARRFAVRVRNHAKMVDCYLTTYYNHKSLFGNKKLISNAIIERPQDYHIYEGLSTLTNISRYDLPDPDVYRDFFRLNALYDFQQLSATCTYFRGCPINKLDVAIAYDLPELVGKHKKMVEREEKASGNDKS